ncbi:hypothetical protein IAI10_02570 [Clostridium sp. 19966]|uniref:hypothetical protein n=1 Tax=Clostridium sp. 19966 TaxID=2768166 RepID=UPI0028E023B9|nr:hypothetical protein [Clostridium sp. 19966]MDT8715543.1 hypothetical protein [Clostridium sp. 19966]
MKYLKIKKRLLFGIIIIIFFIIGIFVGSYLTKINNTFGIFLINNRSNIVIGIITGIVSSTIMAIGFYFKSIFDEADIFCRNLLNQLMIMDILLSKFDRQSKSMDKEIYIICHEVIVKQGRYEKYIKDKTLRNSVIEIGQLMKEIRTKISQIVVTNEFAYKQKDKFDINSLMSKEYKIKLEGYYKELDDLQSRIKEYHHKLFS